MTEHDKISSYVEATASSEHVVALSQGRRRLVKGAVLAMPAVMTLRSGSLAAASITCFQKAQTNPPTPPAAAAIPNQNGDGFLRAQVKTFEKVGTNDVKFYYDNVKAVFRKISDGSQVNESKVDQGASGPDYYAAAYIGEDGQIVSLGPGETNAILTSAAGGCMNSLKMG